MPINKAVCTQWCKPKERAAANVVVSPSTVQMANHSTYVVGNQPFPHPWILSNSSHDAMFLLSMK